MTVTRRLAAILAADVAGYSRLMAADEAGTLARLKLMRADHFEPAIRAHGGRLVGEAGDSLLVEFASASAAVTCAVEVQDKLAALNAELPEDRRMRFRMGINLGEIIADGATIHGDGVNIAARLEKFAEPGSVIVARVVHDQVKGKVPHRFEDLGDQTLHNIAEPVRAYRVVVGVGSARQANAPSGDDGAHGRQSIAVLPFTNMSGDAEQEYFSDGITEDITTELSRFKNLFVIARNSAFRFKGQAVDVKEVGHKLGAGYILEGSVRKAGARVRITAQLVETASGNHVWAERYDRDLEDIFAVQDEVVRAIAGVIPGHLDRAAVDQSRRKPPSNLTAYDCERRGRWAFLHLGEGLRVALDWYEKALAADPDYAMAHAGLGLAYAFGTIILGLSPETALARGTHHAQRAISLDERNPTVNALAAFAFHVAGEHALARKHGERAVALNPNDPFAQYVQGCALSYTGEPALGRDWIERSARLDAYAPDDQRLDTLCDCHYMLRDYAKVIEIHRTYQNVPAPLYLILAAAYAQLGRIEEARASVAMYERSRPPEHDMKAMLAQQFRMCSRQEDRDHWREGYRKAGLIP